MPETTLHPYVLIKNFNLSNLTFLLKFYSAVLEHNVWFNVISLQECCLEKMDKKNWKRPNLLEYFYNILQWVEELQSATKKRNIFETDRACFHVLQLLSPDEFG